MNEALISSILNEVKGECNIPSSYSDQDAMLSNYIAEGLQMFTNLIPLVDYVNDYSARALVKIYVQYRKEGIMNLFEERYAREIISLQIRYVNV